MIFLLGMLFRENKRLKSKKDKETLERFKRDIFDNYHTGVNNHQQILAKTVQ